MMLSGGGGVEHTIAKKKLYNGQSPTFLNINLFRPVGGLKPCPSTPSGGRRTSDPGPLSLRGNVRVGTICRAHPKLSQPDIIEPLLLALHQVLLDAEVYLARLAVEAGELIPEGFRSAPVCVSEVCVYPLNAVVFSLPNDGGRTQS